MNYIQSNFIYSVEITYFIFKEKFPLTMIFYFLFIIIFIMNKTTFRTLLFIITLF